MRKLLCRLPHKNKQQEPVGSVPKVPDKFNANDISSALLRCVFSNIEHFINEVMEEITTGQNQ